MQLSSNGSRASLKRTWQKRARLLTIIIAIPLMLAVLWIAYAIFSGVRINLASEPDPNSSILVKDRQSEITLFQKTFAAITQDTTFTSYGMANDDFCAKGVDTERKAPYSYECTLRLSAIYGFAGDFVTQMTTLQTILAHSGWPVTDSYYTTQLNEAVQFNGDGGSGPYASKGAGLELNYENVTEADHIEDFQTSLADDSSAIFYHKIAKVNLDTVRNQIIQTQGQYLLQVSIEGHYFVD